MIEPRRCPQAYHATRNPAAAARRVAVFCVLLFVCGCATQGNLDLLEARLRQQEDRLFELQARLEETQAELVVARKEAEGLRTQLSSQGQSPILPEQAQALYRAEGVRFNSLLTGGLDTDGSPGDDLISAVLAPHDSDGDLVKLPGAIEIELLDLSQPHDRRRIGHWEYPLEESREHWHSGLVGSGYLFKLPWQRPPESSELLLHARMTTPDQRQFDAAIQVEIEPGNPPRQPSLFLEDEVVPAPEPAIQQTSFRVDGPFHSVPEFDPATQAEQPDDETAFPIRTSDSWTDATIPRYR